MLLFFNDTATTEIYTLSLHDALPICVDDAGRHISHPDRASSRAADWVQCEAFHSSRGAEGHGPTKPDRKSTRLNSSHANISYAVFCLKKKKKRQFVVG